MEETAQEEIDFQPQESLKKEKVKSSFAPKSAFAANYTLNKI